MSKGKDFLEVVLVGLLVLLPLSVSASPRQGDASTNPVSVGSFLVASPELADPNFSRSVVLICAHGADGSLGVIVNRRTRLLLSEVLPEMSALQGTSYHLFSGGPVQRHGILMLYRIEQQPATTLEVLDGVYFGANMEALEEIVTDPHPTDRFRAYAGHAGWAPGQLDLEIAGGFWTVLPAASTAIFDHDPAELWSDMLEGLRRPLTIRYE